jgi:hypothetical protein
MSNPIWGPSQNNPFPQTPVIDEVTKMPTRAWQVWLLNLLNFSSSPTATKGGAVLPSAPAGFMNVTINGKQYKVPYYNV